MGLRPALRHLGVSSRGCSSPRGRVRRSFATPSGLAQYKGRLHLRRVCKVKAGLDKFVLNKFVLDRAGRLGR